MDKSIIEQLAIDNPDGAEAMLRESSRPSQHDIEYLRFLLSQMRGKEDRTIDPSWRDKFHGRVENYSVNVGEAAKELLDPNKDFSDPQKGEAHDWSQEQGATESADPAPEYNSGNQ